MTDKEIIELIDNIPNPFDFTFSDPDITYLKNFLGCDPPVPLKVIGKIQEAIKEKFPFVFEEDPFGGNRLSALVNGYGADKVLENSVANLISYQNEYYCMIVARALNQQKWLGGTYKVRFRDLADYFATGYKENNLKYNVVVVTPDQYSTYHEIDNDYNFKKLNSFAYYILRGFYFVRPGGMIFSAAPTKYEQDIRDGMQFIKGNENAILSIKQINNTDYSLITIEHKSQFPTNF